MILSTGSTYPMRPKVERMRMQATDSTRTKAARTRTRTIRMARAVKVRSER